MINLKQFISLRTMKYREVPKEKHSKRMTMETPNFMDVMIPYNPPHENDSRKTLEELKYLQSLETDKDYAKKYDEVPKVFVELLKEFDAHTPQREKIIDTLVEQSRKFIMTAKYNYNRPRPYQIAEFYGIDLNGTKLDSMKTPSYPSGHATQGYLVAEVLKSMIPHMTPELDMAAEDIANSRIVAKAHFPSDKEFGKKVAKIIHQGFRKSLSEDIKIDVNVGDTILTGRFKNKKTKVKSIGKDEHGMPTINGRKVVTFRRMPKLKELIERVDFVDTARQIIKQQGLKSKVKVQGGSNKADYDWNKDIIYIRPSYATMKDFLTTIYHEIDHAKDRKKYGAKTYEKKYQRAGDIAVNKGKDFHDDNFYEEKAERYGRKMAAMHMRKK